MRHRVVVRSSAVALVASLVVLAGVSACGREPTRALPSPIAAAAPSTRVPDDPHSAAQPNRTAVTHLALELTVDFDRQRLRGTAAYTLDRKVAGADLILDTESLEIIATRACGRGGPALAHALGPADPLLGAALTITVPAAVGCVEVEYQTTPGSRALLWVAPPGTRGGVHPMLFTQSQPINGRSWLPSQDSPGVRFTYDAVVHVPPDLIALMSAENPQARTADGTYRFRMAQPIPSYLVALAVGDFAFRPIGVHTGVYAEPTLVDAAAAEFVEVDAMMTTAEELYGPYRWGRYDLLVLPPSFPMGGMENPRLTFLTPTVITGDRTMVSLIAHELAHSWSGNLVTNATWSSVWLNEGVTTYVERRIMERLRGAAVADLLWHAGRIDLDAEIARFADDRLRTQLDQKLGPRDDPRGAMTEIAYEKGALLLRTLEQRLGRARFDEFLRARFDRLAFRSSDTTAFIADVRTAFRGELEPMLATWLEGLDVPADAAPATSALATSIADAARAFASAGTPVDARGWKTLEWVTFLRSLPADLTTARLRELDRAHQLTASPNPLVGSNWLPILIAHDERAAAPIIDRFVTTIGRRLLVRPVYAAMARGGPFWLARARAVFAAASAGYHPLTRAAIAELLDPPPP